MKWFFDTSVLIPVFMEDHTHHELSLAVFALANKKDACCAAHSLAEVYATMTRLPGRYRLSGDQVLLLLEAIEERLTVIGLDTHEYYSAIKEAAGNGIFGGTIYDALLARCALKAKVATIYTWNVEHFRRMGSEVAERVKSP